MAVVNNLEVALREKVGKGAARATRRAGFIPAVIYGNKEPPVAIAIEPRALWAELNKAGFLTRLFDVSVGNKKERVICRDWQRHPVSGRPLHVDFLRVTGDSRIHVHVPIHFTNHEKSPGIKRGGVLNIVAHEIEVIAPGNAIPSELIIDLTGLEIGTSVHLSALKLPEGVTPVTHEKNPTLATIIAPTVASAQAEATPES